MEHFCRCGKNHNACGHCCTKSENLSVKIQGKLLLSNINLHINCHEILAIVGPNGAGKSTLLKAFLGQVPYTGKIFWQVRGEKERKPRMGYVPQSLEVDRASPITVQDFLASSLSLRPVFLGVSRAVLAQINAALDEVSARQLLLQRLGVLSGGELQRVLLAMSLLHDPDMLLLDEPVSGVDLAGLEVFYATVKRLRDTRDVAIMLVTHDLVGIAAHVDRMLLLNRSVIAEGCPTDVLSSPELKALFGTVSKT